MFSECVVIIYTHYLPYLHYWLYTREMQQLWSPGSMECMYNQVSTHQHFSCLGAYLPALSMSRCPLPTFSSSSWMGSFNLSIQMRCSHWKPMTPLDKALGEHTSHSNPTLRVCGSLSPGIETSVLGRSKSWVLCRVWEGLKRFSLLWGWGNSSQRAEPLGGNQLMAWVWGFPVERRWSKAWKVLFDSPLPWVIPVEWDSVDSPSASLRRVQTLVNGQWAYTEGTVVSTGPEHSLGKWTY